VKICSSTPSIWSTGMRRARAMPARRASGVAPPTPRVSRRLSSTPQGFSLLTNSRDRPVGCSCASARSKSSAPIFSSSVCRSRNIAASVKRSLE
jgi:hypothetical protein